MYAVMPSDILMVVGVEIIRTPITDDLLISLSRVYFTVMQLWLKCGALNIMFSRLSMGTSTNVYYSLL